MESESPDCSNLELLESKLINDNVHGCIRLSGDLMRIVDTPEVQRLRNLQQLGLGSYVYPGATHTRFAHSIGVCHLAGRLLSHLRDRQPELKITPREIFLVQVAGLCHDLGHGPYSHMFDMVVKTKDKNWRHERASQGLFERMLEKNDLGDLFPGPDKQFVLDLIHSSEDQVGQRKIEGKKREFLYEIVANERTGIDVDKFDYFARDSLALGIDNMFSHERYIEFICVQECDDGQQHICVKDKELNNIIIMFQTRLSLYMAAYKHPVVCALDKMVCDVFEAAGPYLKFEGDDGRLYSLVESVKEMGAYARLTDSILLSIRDLTVRDEYDQEKKRQIEIAQRLINRIYKRRLYRLVYHSRAVPSTEPDEIEAKIWTLGEGKFDRADIYVQIAKFDFGMKALNPLSTLFVYSKDGRALKPFHESMVSQILLPKMFLEKQLRVYCRCEDSARLKSVKEAALKWAENRNLQGHGPSVDNQAAQVGN